MINSVKAMIESLSPSQQQDVLAWLRTRHPIHRIESVWRAPAEIILEAIDRASDLSKRGVLGLVAEAAFKVSVIDQLPRWRSEPVPGDAPFDFCIESEAARITIQVKRQRLERHVPKYYARGSPLYVVETQRTRSGTDASGISTRPYRFGEFDILAVSMQPATDDWTIFRFAPQRWLLPRPGHPGLLKVLQPVSLAANGDWTGDLEECIARAKSGVVRRVAEF